MPGEHGVPGLFADGELIERGLLRAGGIDDEHALGRSHRGQSRTPLEPASALPLERIVAARIEHEDHRARAARQQSFDHSFHQERSIAHQLFLPFADIRNVGRQQVVLAADLEAVPREEEERDVAGLDRLVEGEQRFAHGATRPVFGHGDRKADLAQAGADRARVVHGGLQLWNAFI